MIIPQRLIIRDKLDNLTCSVSTYQYVKRFIKLTSVRSKLNQKPDRTDVNPSCEYQVAYQSLTSFGVLTGADLSRPSSTLC